MSCEQFGRGEKNFVFVKKKKEKGKTKKQKRKKERKQVMKNNQNICEEEKRVFYLKFTPTLSYIQHIIYVYINAIYMLYICI